ncbi:MAG: ribosomal protein S18-alanine N-acetyltransferase [Lachnospiraceae bacterium]|nr:ribosomal protein S18-alanine N-acetyltransferase [Lachnospiraceae bacterium]
MCKLNIRRMEEGDLDQVCAIEEETFSMPWSRKSFQDTISYYHTLFLVAELDGEIAGYCGCYQSLEEAEITNIAVRRQLRGHGIGRRLLMELMRLGKEQGAFAYTLEVRVSNQAAIHLYESLGFVSFGIRKNFYEKPREDAMIMWRHWEA